MSVKKNLKKFKAWLHYGDSAHPPMHTASFYGNRYDLNVLIRQAKAEGEPLRVQLEDEPKRAGRRVAKRKRSYTTRSKTTRSKVKKRRTLTRLRRVRMGVGRHQGGATVCCASAYPTSRTRAANLVS